jgi:hypothetical protein
MWHGPGGGQRGDDVLPVAVRQAVNEAPRGPGGDRGMEVVEERAHGWWRNDTARVRV